MARAINEIDRRRRQQAAAWPRSRKSTMLAIILALPALVVHHNDIAPSLKLRGGVALDTKTLNTINGLYHVGFGAALYADPNAFADSGASPIKYTADAEGPVGAFTSRAFGAMMLALSSAAYFDPESTGVLKAFAIAEALFTPILVKNIQDGEPAFKKKMWIFQSFVHIPLAALMLFKAFK